MSPRGGDIQVEKELQCKYALRNERKRKEKYICSVEEEEEEKLKI